MTAEKKDFDDEVKLATVFERNIDVNKLFVHYRDQPGGYARPLKPRRVQKLVAEFDPQAVGVLLLSLREDGTYAIIDGQHRWEAAKLWGMAAIDGYVYIDLTIQEEAALFRKFGDYLKQTALDRYVAALTEEHRETLAIDKILADVGLHASRSGGPEAGGVLAINAIQTIASEYGPQLLIDTLHLLKDVFGITASAYTAQAVWGTAMFVLRFKGHKNLQRKRLVERMRSDGISGILSKAHAVRSLEKASINNAWGKALLAIHDAGLQEHRRLGAWPSKVLSLEGKKVLQEGMKNNALPASINQRRRKMAPQAIAEAHCPRCRAEPGAECRNVKGYLLGKEEAHSERLVEARAQRIANERRAKKAG